MRLLNYQKVEENIVDWLENYSKTSGTKGYVVGVSGGIDSAVVSTLCAKTKLPLVVLEMPIHQDINQVNRATKHIEWLKENYPNVKNIKIDLTQVYDTFKSISDIKLGNDESFEFNLSNTRSRLRMASLYQIAGQLRYLVVGTGNKVEDFGIGFFTKYGDGGVDLSPIADLMKSEVRGLGEYLGVIGDIITAKPTDGLHDDGRTDEDQIGATYDELEWAMDFVLDNTRVEQGIRPFLDYDESVLSDREKEVLSIYLDRHNKNKHKMVSIPVFRVYEDLMSYEEA